jgi:hypothetical protein
MKNFFRRMRMYTALTQDTNAVFINQLLTSHVFRRVHIMMGLGFLTGLPSNLKGLMHEKAQFKIALKTIFKYTLILLC